MEKGVEGMQVSTLSSGRMPWMLPAVPGLPVPSPHAPQALLGRSFPSVPLEPSFFLVAIHLGLPSSRTLGFDTGLTSVSLSVWYNAPVLGGPLRQDPMSMIFSRV